MPKFAIRVPHALGQDEAVRRIQERFDSIAVTYQGQIQGIQQEWQESLMKFAFQAMGVAVSGTVTVEPAEVNVQTELPLMAMMFKGAVESKLREELTKILA